MRPFAAGAPQSETAETDPPAARPSDRAVTDSDDPDREPSSHRAWLVWARRAVSVGLIIGGGVAAYGRRHEIHQAVDRIGNPAWGWLLCACITQASSMIAFARLQRWLLRTGGIRVR
ncbi:MAG: hypothetical protein M3Y36_08805, partial [Actinomycetota bacterium]|nr:hypothetical protein [Actinomycetota bacterium]